MTGSRVCVGIVLLATTLLHAPAAVAQLHWTRPDKFAVGQEGEGLGQSLALDGDWLVVGAPRARVGSSAAGAAYVYARTGNTWTQAAKLISGDPGNLEDFGNGVALEGDTIAVASQRDNPAGAVYVFERQGSNWILEDKLVPPGVAGFIAFGSVSLEGDTLAVGAHFADGQGAVYVFARTAGQWSFESKVVAPDGEPDEQFGMSVRLHGRRLACGARFDDDAGPLQGSAYVFRRSGLDWALESKLVPLAGQGFYFGEALDLVDESLVVKSSAGLHVYRLTDGGWSPEATFKAADGEELTGPVLRADSELLISGAWHAFGQTFQTGAVYVFARDHGSWTQELKLWAPDGQFNDYFGLSVGLQDNELVIGARDHDAGGMDAGACYAGRLFGSVQYGVYLAGANIASLESAGIGVPAGRLRFDVGGFNGTAPAVLIASPMRVETRLAGGTLLIGHNGLRVLGLAPLVGGTGSLEILPDWPANACVRVQAFQQDPQQPGGLTFSNGLELILGP